jgi:hypothetical protein
VGCRAWTRQQMLPRAPVVLTQRVAVAPWAVTRASARRGWGRGGRGAGPQRVIEAAGGLDPGLASPSSPGRRPPGSSPWLSIVADPFSPLAGMEADGARGLRRIPRSRRPAPLNTRSSGAARGWRVRFCGTVAPAIPFSRWADRGAHTPSTVHAVVCAVAQPHTTKGCGVAAVGNAPTYGPGRSEPTGAMGRAPWDRGRGRHRPELRSDVDPKHAGERSDRLGRFAAGRSGRLSGRRGGWGLCLAAEPCRMLRLSAPSVSERCLHPSWPRRTRSPRRARPYRSEAHLRLGTG